MITKITQLIQYLLLNNQFFKKKLILISFDNFLIEKIKKKYQKKFPLYTQFITIEKFLEKISGLSLCNKEEILLYFFYILKKENSHLVKSFHDFFQWAPNILNDFQDLDFHLIKIESFFSSIISIEKIKKWNLVHLEKKLKNNVNEILFWEKIYQFYIKLKNQLLKKKQGYIGLIFRIAINYLKKYLHNHLDIQIIFLNSRFYLLNEYEKKFIKKIITFNQVSIYHFNEKNIFTQNISNLWINKKIQSISIHDIYSKNIKIINVNKEIEQIKIIEKLIKKLIKKGNKLSQIVLLLGDNYLLLPLLYSLKKNIKISFSIYIKKYPLQNILIHHTFISIFKLLLKKDKIKKFYKPDILRVFYDGYIKKIFFKKKFSIIEKLNTENSNFISKYIINKYIQKNDLNIIFNIKTDNIKNCVISFISFIKILKNFLILDTKQYFLELKFILKLEKYMQKFKILVRKTKKNIIDGITDLFNIYQNFIKNNTISYIKKKSKSLLIISFMDFYVTPFENIIITSVNEGCIPPNIKKKKTFIPFDLRMQLNISIYQENEYFYFYHFKNILNNSKNIYLIYKNQADELNSGEKSRFIYQIEKEYSSFFIKKKIKFPFFFNLKQSPIIIEKTKSIIQRLSEISNHGFSPSSIHLYNYNPLLFYYQKILKIKNIQKISIKQKIGTIIHKILELLYNPIKGQFITIDLINKMKKNSKSIIKKIIFENQNNFKEKNIYIFSIVTTYINNFILWEEKFIKKGHKILIKQLEYKISTILNIFHSHNQKTTKVNLYGIIDRIDEYDGNTRIIDYKIGISKIQKINITSNKIEQIFQNPIYVNIMQLLIYMYLYFQSKNLSKLSYHKILPIITIISPEKNKYNSINSIPILFIKKENITYTNYIKFVLPFLIKKISEILNPNIPIIENKINNF